MMTADFPNRERAIVDGDLVHPAHKRPTCIFVVLGKRGQSSEDDLALPIGIHWVDVQERSGFAIQEEFHSVIIQLANQMMPSPRHIVHF